MASKLAEVEIDGGYVGPYLAAYAMEMAWSEDTVACLTARNT